MMHITSMTHKRTFIHHANALTHAYTEKCLPMHSSNACQTSETRELLASRVRWSECMHAEEGTYACMVSMLSHRVEVCSSVGHTQPVLVWRLTTVETVFCAGTHTQRRQFFRHNRPAAIQLALFCCCLSKLAACCVLGPAAQQSLLCGDCLC